MLRILATLTSVICVAAVVTAIAGVGLLWGAGRLTPESVNGIVDLLDGKEAILPSEPDIPEELAQVAKEEVVDRRAMSILDLTARERELNLLKGLIEAKATEVINDRRDLERAQQAFKKQLDDVEAELLSEAAEQARGILLALPAGDAVAKLMTLTPDEAVMLMKGVSEKQHAKILQEFKTQEQTERGNEIFQAIVRGDPKRKIMQQALNTANGKQAAP